MVPKLPKAGSRRYDWKVLGASHTMKNTGAAACSYPSKAGLANEALLLER